MHTTGQICLPVAHGPYSALPTQGLLTTPHLCESSPNKLDQKPMEVQITEASSETPHKHSTPWAIVDSHTISFMSLLFSFWYYTDKPPAEAVIFKSLFGMIQKANLALLSLSPISPKTNPVLQFPLKAAVPLIIRKQAKQNQSSGFLYQQQCFCQVHHGLLALH